MNKYENLFEMTTEQLEEFIEKQKELPSALIDAVFEVGDSLAIRQLLSQTNDQAVIQRCIDFDDESVNVALLSRIDVTDIQKDKILESAPELEEQRWPSKFNNSESRDHFARWELMIDGYTLVVQKEEESDEKFIGFMFDKDFDEIADVFATNADMATCQHELKQHAFLCISENSSV